MDDQIAANLESVRRRIAAACQRSGRSTAEITLVAVTKTVSAEAIRSACQLGVTDMGENRVQEARDKMPLLRDLPLRWHMIGHLQSNKAGQAVDLFQCVHSVDSVEIAEHLSRRAAGRGRKLAVLLEINIAAEESKFGFRVASRLSLQDALVAGEGGADRLLAAVQRIANLPGLDVQGLMTVAPLAPNPEPARPHFRNLRLLRDQLLHALPQRAWPHLSMGMSDDFEVAIEEGATIIRLGRAIFGPRPG